MAKLKEEVAQIGLRIREQSQWTLLQERIAKEAQDGAMEQSSQRMQAEVDSTRQ